MDQGKVIGSNVGDDWNAIDPDVVLDERKQPWLAFGSFWGGIKLRKLGRGNRKAFLAGSNSLFTGEPSQAQAGRNRSSKHHSEK